ncbi:hypothetical protein [Stenotrophomonas maltophilia]|uniref:hypothetical protein n=1 Tax=Stenotrophomonas maltophilia TaxID=40324 RepID=UPI0013D95E70|nr:hypothetical protein [Stenotrophomonas maltophilia]
MTRIDFVGRGLLLSATLTLAACTTSTIKPTPPSPIGAPYINGVNPGKLIVHTLPVGAGNCQIAQCPSGNRLIVMDCGARGRGSQGWDRTKVKSYVETLTDSKSEITVSVSHPHADHYSYITTAFEGLPVKYVYLGGKREDYSQTFRDWIVENEGKYGTEVKQSATFYSSSPSKPEPGLSCWKSQGGGSSEDVSGYILGAGAGESGSKDKNKNDESMVVAMRYGEFTTTFTGDMTGVTWDAIQKYSKIRDFKTNLLTGAHHGSSSEGSNSASWAGDTRPQFLIFSAGERFDHPRCEAVDRYTTVLSELPLHDYWCGDGGAGEERTTQENILVTESNGLIVIEADSKGTMKRLPVEF